ncbi:30S ribosomal protein S20 [bacterium (Candidatus Gribaldobacteria) CG23_combo_of_CG06-09_8_20_14_all_37_87_8]|uniref:Small ribosomal subunit protein bS20 n=2 Tax=Candidatus Gribaldobacteria TaxID=2798536 RepID=A0A2G9ZES6_9BACT|nr:MAG: 30S ribosomal protein S20 [bacterium (Candidatus Gribaldobacteria) CG23_combo_of_CG06-09_8_20_14_all_37_87_8]PIR89971.1 MAG: 30S ribosomal protein S20 [bacterium (Candidatus Gribaldobacteria) CG10_big_fil_rev_8_21_14_0_10_37_21]
MAITTSAKKALRSSKTKRKHNIGQGNKLKKLLKEAQILIKEGKKEEAKKLLPSIYKALDKATKTNLIKKNKASRKKSRISKALKA